MATVVVKLASFFNIYGNNTNIHADYLYSQHTVITLIFINQESKTLQLNREFLPSSGHKDELQHVVFVEFA